MAGTTELREQYIAAIRPRVRATGLAGALAIMVLFPAWSLYDHLLLTEHAAAIGAARLYACVPVAVISALLAWHPWGRSHPEVLAVLLLMAPAIVTAGIIPLSGEHLPITLLGYSTFLYGSVFLLAFEPRWVATSVVLLTLPVAAADALVGTTEAWLISMLYLGSAAVVVIFATFIGDRSSFKEFESRHELLRERSLNASLIKRMELQSRVDPLTDLANRRQWQESLKQAWRREPAFSVALIDIDHFKEVNDNWGHAAGDTVLSTLAEHFLSSLSEDTLVARLGGDEIALLATDCDEEPLARICRRLAQDAREMEFRGLPGLRVTLSIGVASRGPEDESTSDVLARADLRLYRAKITRNAVCASDEDDDSPSDIRLVV